MRCVDVTRLPISSVANAKHLSIREPVAFIRYIQSVGIGKPDAEGICRGSAVTRKSSGEPRHDRNRERSRGLRLSGPLWQFVQASPTLIHRIDAVAAASLGDIQRFIEDRQAAEVIVFAGFIRRRVKRPRWTGLITWVTSNVPDFGNARRNRWRLVSGTRSSAPVELIRSTPGRVVGKLSFLALRFPLLSFPGHVIHPVSFDGSASGYSHW